MMQYLTTPPAATFTPFLQSVICEVTNSTQAPVPLICSALLGAMSEAAQGGFDVDVPGYRVTPISIWVMLLGESGIGKSPVENILRKPIRDLEAQQTEEASKKLKQYESQVRVWKTIRNALTKELSKQTLLEEATEEIEKRLEAHQLRKPIKPKNFKTGYKDVTPTACVFRANLDTDSTGNWTVIPPQTGHRFQRKLDS